MSRNFLRSSILRPLVIVAAAFLLALAIERLSFPSISLSLFASDAAYRVVYGELKGTESTLWLADPADPMGRRRSLLKVSHQDGYGVTGSVSPDGASLAYGFLPSGLRDAFSQGQLWVSPLNSPRPRLISGKMDLHFRPIWSPDGGSILFRVVEDLPDQGPPIQVMPSQKSAEGTLPVQRIRSNLVVASLDSHVSPRTVFSSDEYDLYPAGWSVDGRSVFYYSLDSNGSEAWRIDVETSQTSSLGKLADEPVWGVRLSPDSSKLLYLRVFASQSGNQESLWLFDVRSGQTSRLAESESLPTGATWHSSRAGVTRSGRLASGKTGLADMGAASDGTGSVLKESSGDVTSIPVSWSPDDMFLAVRNRSVAADGRIDNLAVLDSRSGSLKEIKGGYAEILGWTDKAK